MISRRTMLQHTSLATLGLAASELPGLAFPADWLPAQEDVVPFTDVPADFATLNATTKRVAGLDLRELTSYTTPETNYFVVAHYGVPRLMRRRGSLTSAAASRIPAVIRWTN